MNNKLEKIIEAGKGKIQTGKKITEQMSGNMLNDITQLYNSTKTDFNNYNKLGIKKVNKLIDYTMESDIFRDIGKIVIENATLGLPSIKEKVLIKVDEVNKNLDKLVMEDPKKVGLIDGFTSIYSPHECNRRPRSQMYNTHVTYGKGIGITSIPIVFSANSLPRIVIAGLPILTRGNSYLKQKFEDAKSEV